VDKALNQLKITNQQLQEKYQFEKDMMGIMGHELRTPMTVARGMSELLINKVDKDVAKETGYFKDKLEKIHMSILKESDLIQTMLSTSHIDNNKMDLQLTKFDFIDLVDYAVMAFRKEGELKGLKVNYKKPTVPMKAMYSDQSRTQEVVNNLISNAIKYTNKGSVTIRYEAIDDFVHFSVIDTGIGIPEDQMPNIGKKFYRVHQYLDDKKDVVRAGGTGLGLYVVKGILEAVRGKLKIESIENKGSTFTAIMPLNAHPNKDESFITQRPIDKNDMFEELGYKFINKSP
jgi:signal transduction histidine kinase